MRERTITLFVEDFAHQQVIGPLVLRLAAEHGAAVRLDWRSAVRGHGAVVRELGGYLRNLSHGGGPWPDLFAEDIVRRMDVERTTRADRSFKRFVEDLRATFRGWRA